MNLQHKSTQAAKRSVRLKIFLSVCFFLSISGCTDSFLDVKPDKKLVIPQTLNDLQAMLDNTDKMNVYGPSVAVISADDYYVTSSDWNSLTDITARNAYIWDDDLFNDRENNDWSYPYVTVLYSNIVLENLQKIAKDSRNASTWNNIKGAALIFRAYSFYQLSQLFMKPYDPASASADPGIPLRLSSDLNEKSVRSTVKETYDRMIMDASEAATLLDLVPKFKSRPSRPAAYGLLARIYLSMNDYEKAGRYADSCIKLYDTPLIDYNNLNPNASFPIPLYNQEVIFHTKMFARSILSSRSKVDSILYKQYETNDLRKNIFFKSGTNNTVTFKGSYDGSSGIFSGIAVDEMYLVRAECYARTGKVGKAVDDLNLLMKRRYKAGTFVPFKLTSDEEVLLIILRERRKELLFRGLRWTDLRRLNLDDRFKVTLKRELNGITHELAPRSNKYVLPIPASVIETTGMSQNQR